MMRFRRVLGVFSLCVLYWKIRNLETVGLCEYYTQSLKLL